MDGRFDSPRSSRRSFVRGLLLGVVLCGLGFGGYLLATAQAIRAPAIRTHTAQPQTLADWQSPSQTTPTTTGQGVLPAPVGFAAIVAKVEPAVVAVRVLINGQAETNVGPDGLLPFANPGGGADEVIEGLGSGFFISSDGYAVTNNHVVENAERVQVATAGGKIMTAKVIGADPKTDLALIKVDGGPFPYLNLSDRLPRVGDWVLAIGNPFGLSSTVTAGIVSALGRRIADNPYENYIQIDAPVNRGNSGGPSIGMNGEVIGVNTAIYTPSGGSVGIAFDIPAPTVKAIISQLKAHGHVTRGWLGVEVQALTPTLARSLGLKRTGGALIAGVDRNSPAAAAGIRPGDLVTAIDGQPINDPRDLVRKVASSKPGATITLTVERGGAQRKERVALGNVPRARSLQNEGTVGAGR